MCGIAGIVGREPERSIKPMLESSLYRVRGVEGVLWAVPLYKGQARVKINPDVATGNRPTVIAKRTAGPPKVISLGRLSGSEFPISPCPP